MTVQLFKEKHFQLLDMEISQYEIALYALGQWLAATIQRYFHSPLLLEVMS